MRSFRSVKFFAMVAGLALVSQLTMALPAAAQIKRSTTQSGRRKSTTARKTSSSSARTTASSQKRKSRLPNHFGKLDLKDSQRKEIYSIQAKYRAQIEALEKQLEALKDRQMSEVTRVLTTKQRSDLAKFRSAAKSGASTSGKKASARKSGAKKSTTTKRSTFRSSKSSSTSLKSSKRTP